MYGSLFGSFDSPAFDDFRLVENALDQLVGRFAPSAAIRAPQRAAFPPANVGATPERVDVYLFAAGVEPKGLDISIQQNLLIVSGSRNVPVDEQADYYRKERFAGEFRRVIALPAAAYGDDRGRSENKLRSKFPPRQYISTFAACGACYKLVTSVRS